jgi:spore germination protein GerM
MISKALRRPAAVLFAMLLVAMSLAPVVAYHEGDDADHEFADPAFETRWARTDLPVEQGEISRTWMWGPKPYTEGMMEDYADSPGGERLVQYFDKSRMEINHPDSPDDSVWYVTNGLLVVEMVDGRMQVGDEEFVDAAPAQVQIAGDPNVVDAPTYADINSYGLRGLPASGIGAVIDQTLVDGEIVQDPRFAEYGVTAAYRVSVPNVDHTVASVFWDFMNSAGTVYVDGEYVEEDLFLNPFYATGLPITEAYWTTVPVAATAQDVLWQCFERRCLTYTPANPEGFQVEAGNVGQHYYQWRYGDVQPPETETVQAFLVALEDAGENGILIGCDDSLVPVSIEIDAQENNEDRIAAALAALFGLEHETLYNVFANSTLSVESVVIEDGVATVNLTGDLVLGGECDDPRVVEQLAHTITQFAGVTGAVVLLNGEPIFDEEPETETINVYLVAPGEAEEPVDEPEEGSFGCMDVLVPVEVQIPTQDSLEGRVDAALNALFGHESDEYYNVFLQSDLAVADIQIINGVATINLSGDLLIGGICDEPRIIEQLSATVEQFDGVDRVVLLVNGAHPFMIETGELEGGVLATFNVSGEQFKVWVTNEETIADILEMEADPEIVKHPHGPILNGAGQGNHNLPWSWHLDPEATEMVEASIEVCDGRPSYVEGEVDEFVDVVEAYCPWSAELVEVQDFRVMGDE